MSDGGPRGQDELNTASSIDRRSPVVMAASSPELVVVVGQCDNLLATSLSLGTAGRLFRVAARRLCTQRT